MFWKAAAIVTILFASATFAADGTPVDHARLVAESFYRALAARDFDAASNLWSSDAPRRAERMRDLRTQIVRAGRPLLLRGVEIESTRVTAGDRVELTLGVSLTGNTTQGERPVFSASRSRRRMSLREEGERWLIVMEQSLADELVALVTATSTEAEQAAIVASRPELATPELPAALIRSSILLRTSGDYVAAARLTALASSIAESLGDDAERANVLRETGAIAFSRGDYESALRSYGESAMLRQKAGDRGSLAVVLGNIGLVHRSIGDLPLAKSFYERSLAMSRAIGDDEGTATMIASLGVIHKDLGDYAVAARDFTIAADMQEKLKNFGGLASALNGLANTYRAQGNVVAARGSYEKALAVNLSMGNKAGAASVFNNLGSLALEEGDLRLARDFFQRSLALKQELGDKAGVALVQMNIGALAVRLAEFGDARCWFESTRVVFESLGAHADMAELRLNEAQLSFEQRSWSEAFQLASTAAAEAASVGKRGVQWRSQTLAGRALAKLGRNGEARRELEDAVRTVEALRTNIAGEEERSLYFERVVDPYHALVMLAWKEKERSEAFRWMELARGRVLLDVLRYGHASSNSTAAADRALIQESTRANTELARARNRRGSSKKILIGLVEQQEQARSALAESRRKRLAVDPQSRLREGQVEPLTLDEAEAMISEASALVEYSVTGDGVFAFVMTRRKGSVSSQVKRLDISSTDLRRRAERLHREISQRDLRFARESRELYRLLLGPLASSLRGVTRLIIVPDGPLWLVPFQALLDSKGQFLIERVTVSYAPSVSVIAAMEKKRRRPSGRLSLSAFDALTPPSIENLRSVYGPANTRIFLGADAQERNVKRELGNASIVHIAAHGFFDDRNPMHSHVQLTTTDTDDGMLEAWELLDVRATAEMAVLSGCETARGRTTEGEGMIGMTWALFVAGCPTSVASQWRVDAAMTSTLMSGFYRHLRDHRAGTLLAPAAAMRAAAIELIGTPEYRHPFYWAAFVVMGASEGSRPQPGQRVEKSSRKH